MLLEFEWGLGLAGRGDKTDITSSFRTKRDGVILTYFLPNKEYIKVSRHSVESVHDQSAAANLWQDVCSFKIHNDVWQDVAFLEDDDLVTSASARVLRSTEKSHCQNA